MKRRLRSLSALRTGAPRNALVRGGAIVLLTLLAYLPVGQAGYVWDDDKYLTSNDLVQSANGLAAIWLEPTASPQYYPLVFTSFRLEYALWGLDPRGYHVVNVLLHAASAVVIWRLAAAIGLRGAWILGLLFAVHPVHVESVAWITERKNVLSGLFYLLALAAYLRFDAAPPGRRRRGAYATSLALFVAALLSKSVTATLPVALVVSLWLRRGRLRLVDLAPTLPFWVLGIALGLHTAYLERVHVGALGVEWEAGLLERLLVASRALWFYGQKIVWPYPLIFVYERWSLDPARAVDYVPLAGLVAVAGWAGYRATRGDRGPLALLLYTSATLFPALGFLNVYPHRFSFVADHFNYLGSLGYLSAGVAGVGLALSRLRDPRLERRLGRLAAGGVVVVLVALTFAQSRVYADAAHLWRHTLRHNPDAWLAQVNLAHLDLEAGDLARAEQGFRSAERVPASRYEALAGRGQVALARDDLPQAVALYERALRERPAWAYAHTNLGVALHRQGRLDAAIARLETATELGPDEGPLWLNLSKAYASAGRWDEAFAAARRAVELDPHSASQHAGLAELLLLRDRPAEAAEHYRKALRLPRGAEVESALGLVVALYGSAQYAEAIASCEAQLARFGPDVRLRNQLAWMLATAPEARLRDGERAAGISQALLQQYGPHPGLLGTHAAALAELGSFGRAAKAARTALEAAERMGDAARVAELREQLDAYAAERPWRHAAL